MILYKANKIFIVSVNVPANHHIICDILSLTGEDIKSHKTTSLPWGLHTMFGFTDAAS